MSDARLAATCVIFSGSAQLRIQIDRALRRQYSTDCKGITMLYYAAVFFVIAIVAALLGFGGIAAGASSIAQVLFFIFVVLFLVSLIAGLVRRRN
jgi:uncharacterized membrane protein YtjA (UPF0391 family)